MTHDPSSPSKFVSGTNDIAKLLVRDSGINNLNGELGSCHSCVIMGLLRALNGFRSIALRYCRFQRYTIGRLGHHRPIVVYTAMINQYDLHYKLNPAVARAVLLLSERNERG